MPTSEMDGQSELPWHRPVLVQEVMEFLAPQPGQTLVDCTVGTGGHSLAILPRLLPNGRLLALDCDAQALERAQRRLAEFRPQVQMVHDHFSRLPEVLQHLGIPRVDGLLADVGISSLHVDQPERGFSFLQEGPLDMRMDQRLTTTAASLIQELSEEDLAHLLEAYGEERWARRIAQRIVSARTIHPIQTTRQLARLVAEAIPSRATSRRIHPATRTFLALRIAVNRELDSLQTLLEVLPEVVVAGGRAVIITFHSLEDRLVKQAFRRGAHAGLFKLLTKKPVRPSAQELVENPRSRSAKLRAVETC